MDLFDKFDGLEKFRDNILQENDSPFDLPMEEVASPTDAVIHGRPTILAGTNNYLGLTFDPACMEAAIQAIRDHGTGTTGSRIANGTYAGHLALEKALARFLRRDSCIVFSTGYQANLGVLAGLAGPKDTIFIDADSHASIYDACHLSQATIIRFRHNDPDDLDRRLSRLDGNDSNRLVVVEGMYSMLGDVAPLAGFVEVKKRHNAWLLVDEAHTLGTFGDEGRGTAEAQGVEEDIDFIVGTFSKSLGAIGGYGASNHPRFEMLRIATRPYMFTASPPPSIIASVHAALDRIATDPGLKRDLWRNVEMFHAGLSGLGYRLAAPASPVIAVICASPAEAFGMWQALLERGVYVNLAVPPGTPGSLSLLRCSISAAHRPEQIEAIVAAFRDLALEMDLSPAAE